MANELTSVAQNPSVLQVAATPLANDDHSVLESTKEIMFVLLGMVFRP